MTDFSKSEWSDKEIVQRTSVEADSGRMRFVVALPSGRTLESEWFQESNKTRWLLKWCAAVNQEIRNDAAEELAKQKRKAQENRPALAGVPSAAPGLPLTIQTGACTSSPTSAEPFLSADPFAFLERALEISEAEYRRCHAEAATAGEALTKAEDNLKKWKAMKAALEAK